DIGAAAIGLAELVMSINPTWTGDHIVSSGQLKISQGANSAVIAAAALSSTQQFTLPSVGGTIALPGDFSDVMDNDLSGGSVFVGNTSGEAVGVALTGDATISNTGVLSIVDGRITGAMLANETVASADIADDTISTTEMTVGGLMTAEITDNSIMAADIAAGGVTTHEIASGTVGALDLATGMNVTWTGAHVFNTLTASGAATFNNHVSFVSAAEFEGNQEYMLGDEENLVLSAQMSGSTGELEAAASMFVGVTNDTTTGTQLAGVFAVEAASSGNTDIILRVMNDAVSSVLYGGVYMEGTITTGIDLTHGGIGTAVEFGDGEIVGSNIEIDGEKGRVGVSGVVLEDTSTDHAYLLPTEMTENNVFRFPFTGGTVRTTNSLIDGTELRDTKISAVDITTGGAGSAEVEDGVVTADEIAASGVTPAEIADGAVGATDIIAGAVTTIEIADYSVDNADISSTAGIFDIKVSDSITVGTSGTVEDGALTANVSLLGQTIESLDIRDGEIGSSDIGDAGITAAEITTSGVWAQDIATSAVLTAEIADGAVGEAEVAASAVFPAEILDGTLVAADIGAGAVGAAELVLSMSPTWTGTHIVSSGNLKIKQGSAAAVISVAALSDTRQFTFPGVGGTLVTIDDVTGIRDRTLAERSIYVGNASGKGAGVALTGDATITNAGAMTVLDGSMTGAKISDGTVMPADIATDAVQAMDITTQGVSSAEILDGIVTAGEMTDAAVGEAEVQDGAVTADDIAGDAVRTAEIEYGAIGSVDIATGAVTSAEIASGVIGTSELDLSINPTWTGNHEFGVIAVSGSATFNGNVAVTLVYPEQMGMQSTMAGATDGTVMQVGLTNNTESATQMVMTVRVSEGSSAATETVFLVENADTDTGVTKGIEVRGSAAVTTGLDVSDSDIETALAFGSNDLSGDNWLVTGSSGNAVFGTLSLKSGNTTAVLTPSAMTANQTFRLPVTGGIVALTGDSWTTSQITDGTVTAADIADGVVQSAEIIVGAVGSDEIAVAGVTGAEIEDGAISATEIIAGGVTTSEIADYIVDNADISSTAGIFDIKVSDSITVGALGTVEDGALTASVSLLGQTVESTEIRDGEIGVSDIGVAAITAAEITTSGVWAQDITTGAVLTAEIADGAVSEAEIAAGAVLPTEILDGSLVAADIGAGAVGLAELIVSISPTWTGEHVVSSGNLRISQGVNSAVIAVAALSGTQQFMLPSTGGNVALVYDVTSASKLSNTLAERSVFVGNASGNAEAMALTGDGTITSAGAFSVLANSVTGAKITDNTITAVDISTDTLADTDINSAAVGGAEMTDNSIGAQDLSANSVRSQEVLDGSVTAADIAVSAVESDQIINDSITAQDITTGGVATSEILNGTIGAADINAGMTATWSGVHGFNGLSVSGEATFNDDIKINLSQEEQVFINSQLTGSTAATVFAIDFVNQTSDGTQTVANITNKSGSTGVSDAMIALFNDSALPLTAGVSLDGTMAVAVNVSDAGLVLSMLAGSNDLEGDHWYISGDNGALRVNELQLMSGANSAKFIPSALMASDQNFQLPATGGTIALTSFSSITSAAIVDLTIAAQDIATQAVSSAEIKDGAIADADIGADAVGASEIISGAVGTSEISLGISPTWTGTHVVGSGSLVITDGTERAVLKSTLLANQSFVFPQAGGTILLENDVSNYLDKTSLSSAKVFVGNSANIAEARSISGDAAITSAGVFTASFTNFSSAWFVDGTIVQADVADDAVGVSELAADAVGASEIAAGAVGTSELDLTINPTWTGSHVFTTEKFKINDGGGQMAVLAMADISADKSFVFPSTGGTIAKQTVMSRTFFIPSVAESDDFLLFRAPEGLTVTAFYGIVSGTSTTATFNLQECSADGAACGNMGDSALVAHSTNSTRNTFSDDTVDAGDYIKLDISSFSGTPGTLTVVIEYRVY
ncbi:MAG: hypothetical protein HQM16_05185, partial [Deltaproteobacteria bacterium]|nr:hypothetical protein [Deltaproteobacteria bacterium]